MTEEEAKAWLRDYLDVSRETFAQLDALRSLVTIENENQNLVGSATIDSFWSRHIVDSAQLLRFVPERSNAQQQCWVDLGTGAGFPGMVIAILWPGQVTLVEMRRARAAFLSTAVNTLGLKNAAVRAQKTEAIPSMRADFISARAYAPLTRLFQSAQHLSNRQTQWLLPKGKSAKDELETIKTTWSGTFHVEQSITDPDAAILLAKGVQRKKAGK